MKVTGLDGRQYNWNLSGLSPLGSDQTPRSKGHLRARALLEKLFGADRRLEEVPLPGTGGLRADFYLPGRGLMAEVQGRQHGEYVPHYHETPLGFLRSQGRDRRKATWCETNEINLVELPDDESDEQWAARLLAALC